ncbi:MAG: hypothetical protein H6721_29020 [Sandaracinus sp.]|nr:hypothetical protein [Sandaracinus sp.]MCB9613184.1 hypothetical protein [Sandaracinus sp.]MCB9636173.1 hypothetical protein [Sandaracinus sp.]
MTINAPFMDEGEFQEPPTQFEIRSVADASVLDTVILATSEENADFDTDAFAHRAREAVDRVRGFSSFRRMRGPVRASRLQDSLRRLEELERPCRRSWGIPADATFELRELGGTPAEDERCVNSVHDIDLHVDLAHRVGLILLRVGTHTDLCAEGVSTHLFRWR